MTELSCGLSDASVSPLSAGTKRPLMNSCVCMVVLLDESGRRSPARDAGKTGVVRDLNKQKWFKAVPDTAGVRRSHNAWASQALRSPRRVASNASANNPCGEYRQAW